MRRGSTHDTMAMAMLAVAILAVAILAMAMLAVAMLAMAMLAGLVEGGGVLAIQVDVLELDQLIIPRLHAVGVVGACVGVLEGGGGLGPRAELGRYTAAPAAPLRLRG